MNTILRNKSILVIGGSTGIGLAVSQACSRAGAAVTFIGRDRDNCQLAKKSIEGQSIDGQSLEGPCEFLAGDACQPGVVEEALELAVASHGGLDGLCHVAGGSGRRAGDGPLHEISDEGWAFTLRLNLESVFRSNRAAVRHFLEHQRPGSLVNIGSVLADRPAPDYFATHAYAAAKAGIVGMTISAAAKYASKGIRFNLVTPALVETPMSNRACQDNTIVDYVNSRQPLQGVAQPDDIQDAVVFLLSDQARAITGQNLRVDGGWSVSDALPEI